MLVGCVITYNDMPLIKECVVSLYDKVDKLIIVDGRYRDFPGESWDSTDGTLEYVCSLDNADVIKTSGFTELDKRNRYLDGLCDGDIVLNLDSDEILKGSIPPLNSDFGIVDLVDGHSKHSQKRATRFFKFKKGMAYCNVHYTLYLNGRQLNNLKKVIDADTSSEPVRDFYILHNWYRRGAERRHLKSDYYKKLVRMEKGFPR